MYYYRELNQNDVSWIKHDLADRILTRACARLFIGRPALRWFLPAGAEDATFKRETEIYGAAGRIDGQGTILVSAAESPAKIGEIILHELEHIAQFQRHDTAGVVARERAAGKAGKDAHISGYGDLIFQAEQAEKRAAGTLILW